jgi:hypothetical protein
MTNLPATTQSDQFMSLIQKAVESSDVDVAKMQALLDMKMTIMGKQAEAEFNQDYLAAKLEMPRISKDGQVYYEDKNTKQQVKAFEYAKYESIDKAIRPVEQKYGFSRSFSTEERAGGGVVVNCELLHKSGHKKQASIPIPLENSGGKNNVQGMGSSFSYGKRYTTEMLWDIVKEGSDTDGNVPDFPIDDVQFEELQKLITESETDPRKFCEHMKVESLRAITNRNYPKAVQDLKSKIAILKKKGAK